ncbi:unnamed protein product, partial [Nesidiocoris tenuis]
MYSNLLLFLFQNTHDGPFSASDDSLQNLPGRLCFTAIRGNRHSSLQTQHSHR